MWVSDQAIIERYGNHQGYDIEKEGEKIQKLNKMDVGVFFICMLTVDKIGIFGVFLGILSMLKTQCTKTLTIR